MPPELPWAEMTAGQRAAYCLQWADLGYSDNVIARHAATSRGAVVGVLHRAKVRAGLRKAPGARGRNGVPAVQKSTKSTPIRISRAAAFDPIPGVEPKSFIELTRTECHWPVDGTDGPSQFFCGLPIDRLHYCISHYRLSYTSMEAYRRAVKKEAA